MTSKTIPKKSSGTCEAGTGYTTALSSSRQELNQRDLRQKENEIYHIRPTLHC